MRQVLVFPALFWALLILTCAHLRTLYDKVALLCNARLCACMDACMDGWQLHKLNTSLRQSIEREHEAKSVAMRWRWRCCH